jgi:hypothetical protein
MPSRTLYLSLFARSKLKNQNPGPGQGAREFVLS